MKQKGASLIEFAVAATLFLTLALGVVDFSYLFWVNLTMQHAVREGARYEVTGQTNLDPNPQGTPQDRCDAAIAKIRESSMGLYDKLNPTVTFKTIDSSGNIVSLPNNSCGSASQIIMIDVECNSPLLTPLIKPFFAASNGVYNFSVSTTMKNETFR